MHFEELIVQGIRQFPEMTRLTFGAGCTAVFAPPDGRADVLYKTIRAVFFRDTMDGTRPDLVHPGAEASRAALTLIGRDNRRYRLLRDFSGGGISLTVDDGQGNFQVLCTSPQEIQQALGGQVGMPAVDVYDSLMTCAIMDMPSRSAPSPLANLAPETGAMTPTFPPTAVMPGAPGVPGYPAPTGVPGAPIPAVSPNAQTMAGAPMPGMPGAPYAPMAGVPMVMGPDGMMMPAAGAYGYTQQPASPFADMSEEQKRAKLNELRELRRSNEKLRELEFELDGMQRRKFELDDQLSPLREAEEAVQQARQKLAKHSDLADVPEEFIDRLNWFRGELERRDANIATLDQEFAAERAAKHGGADDPLFKDRYFMGGAIGGALALLIGVALGRGEDNPGMWVIALLDIPAFGVAAWALLKRIHNLELGADLGQAEKKLEERKQRVINRFELETADVRKILLRHEVDMKKLDMFEVLVEQREEARRALAAQETAAVELGRSMGIDFAPVSEELAQVEKRIAEFEDKVSKAAGGQADAVELASHIQLLEQELGETPTASDGGSDAYGGYDPGYGGGGAAGPSGGTPPIGAAAEHQDCWLASSGEGFNAGGGGSGSYGGGGGGAPPSSDGGAVVVDVTRAMMEKGSELFGKPADALGAEIAPRLAQYIAAFTDQRFTQVEFGGRGQVSVIEAQGGRKVPFLMLQGPERDVVALSLQFALLEAYAKISPLPVVLNDPFVALPDMKHPLAAKMLKFIGAATQIVHFTSLPSFADQADARIDL